MDRILTVVTPAATRDLTTLDAVKAELGITATDTDALFAKMVTRASAAAVTYCRRPLVSETVSEQIRGQHFRHYPFAYPNYVDGTRHQAHSQGALYLRRYPIAAIASIVEDDDTLVAGTDYEFDPETGRLNRLINGGAAHWMFRKLTVQYTGGYVVPDTLPPEIEEAVIAYVRALWFARRRDPLVRTQTIPGVLETQWQYRTQPPTTGGKTTAWPDGFTDLLDPYVDLTGTVPT